VKATMRNSICKEYIGQFSQAHKYSLAMVESSLSEQRL
jgi:hypothetical protein